MLWLGIWGVWTLLALMSAGQSALILTYRGQHITWAPLILGHLADWYTCAIFTPPLLWLARRFPLEQGVWKKHLPIHALASIVAVFLKYAIYVPLARVIYRQNASIQQALATNILTESMFIWATIGAIHTIEFYRRYRERESLAHRLSAERSRAQLESADAYYDRALVRALQNHRDAAADDYEHYLRLRRDALDRALVVTRVNQLRGRRLSASQAFGLGAVIPGGGQFYTRRPVRGLLSLAGVSAAAAFAMTETKTYTTTTKTAADPFGNQYSYSVTTAKKSRPYLVPGLGAAGGIALFSAINAALYARSVRASSFSVSLVTGGTGVEVVASVSIP